MTKSHAQILADIAAKVVMEHRKNDAPDRGHCDQCGEPSQDWRVNHWPEGGVNLRELGLRSQDLQTRIAEAAAADHTPDWDWHLPEEYQK